jgi:hypothetical protein
MPTKSKSSAIRAARLEYSKVKRAYHTAGKAAFGKPGSSRVKRDYCALKRAYKRVGARLGRLTGRKSR